MRYIGAHVSSDPDISHCPQYAHRLGATAFSFFTAPSNSFRATDIDPEVAERFKAACKEYGYEACSILPHAGFMMNLCSPDKRKLAMGRTLFVSEFKRCEQLGLEMLNFHPGSTLGQIDNDVAIGIVAESINRALDKSAGVTAVIENTAGQGSALGYRLDHIAGIIDKVEDKSRVGVCIDTAHALAAGYNLADAAGLENFKRDFDNIVGRQYLRAMHLNDSVKGCGSRVDRHAPIGQGCIGNDFFAALMADPWSDNLTFILETPDAELWKSEIQFLKNHAR
jgi:deoxyribonuclease-4